MAITAADGTLLWVEGDRTACRKVEAMNFVPGADWSERGAGTNAPGTALALDRELQIRGSEHFSRLVQPWSCTAVPVHDLDTGALIGAIDLTGGPRVASPQTLALVRATVVAVENHLALLRLTGPKSVDTAPGAARLVVLGADRPRWQVTDEHRQLRSTTLTGRHADKEGSISVVADNKSWDVDEQPHLPQCDAMNRRSPVPLVQPCCNPPATTGRGQSWRREVLRCCVGGSNCRKVGTIATAGECFTTARKCSR